MIPAFLGLAGVTLDPDERVLFRAADPAGYILFARNITGRDQLAALVAGLRDLAGREVPILIDQEGGRVARLRDPEWPLFPAAWRFADLYDKAPVSAIEAARVNALAIAATLAPLGINVDCLPLLDVRQSGASDIIGDRALGAEPMQVAALGRAVLDGLRQGGVCGVIKHMPGHGRARVDSHHEMPVVEASADELATDLAPFQALRDAPMGMTAHVRYPVWDADHCATHSAPIIERIIRERIGFDGLLMSDDLAMGALTGSAGQRARAALDAGCDIALHCSGTLADNADIAGSLPSIGEAARERLGRAMAWRSFEPAEVDVAALAAKRDALLAFA